MEIINKLNAQLQEARTALKNVVILRTEQIGKYQTPNDTLCNTANNALIHIKNFDDNPALFKNNDVIIHRYMDAINETHIIQEIEYIGNANASQLICPNDRHHINITLDNINYKYYDINVECTLNEHNIPTTIYTIPLYKEE